MYHRYDEVHTPTTALFRFQEPKGRRGSMLEAYSEGGPVLNNSSLGLSGFIWCSDIEIIEGKSTVVVYRDDIPDVRTPIFKREGLEQLDFTFDQNMRPFFAYMVAGRSYYWHFNAEDSTYSEVPLPVEIKYPRCSLDILDTINIPSSDIILGYARGPNLCFRIQRERYSKERIIATKSNKSMLWRCGLLKDGRFGYQWR